MCALLNICLIAAMVQVGMTIKCFNCDSSSNEGCASMTDKSLVAEDCTEEKLKFGYDYDDWPNHWLFTISTNPFDKNNSGLPMACQKIIGIDENEQRTTVRLCQVSASEICSFIVSRATDYNRTIEHCSLCDEDGCNGSSNNQIFNMMIGMLTAITISMHLIF